MAPASAGGPDARTEPLIIMVQAMSGIRGPAQALLEFVSYLQPRRRLSVALPQGGLADHLRDDLGVPVIHLPAHSERRGAWLPSARALRHEISRIEEPILIHANGLSALNLAAPAARSLHIPVLVHSHDHEIFPSTRRSLQVWRRLHVPTRFVSTSEFTRGLLEGTGAVPVVAGVLASPLVGSDYLREHEPPHDPFRVGFVGGVQRRKGLHNLVQIADLLREEAVEFHIFSIDRALERGGYIGRCVAEIRRLGLMDRFVWHGWIDEISSAYAEVDAVLMPSEKEGFGRVAIEGMAGGLPVVAPRISGFSEVVWDRVSGLLYDPGRPHEAAECMRRLISDPDLRARLRAGGLDAVRRFDIEVVGPMLLEHYAALDGAA